MKRYTHEKKAVQNLSDVRMLAHAPLLIQSDVYHFGIICPTTCRTGRPTTCRTGCPTSYPKKEKRALNAYRQHEEIGHLHYIYIYDLQPKGGNSLS